MKLLFIDSAWRGEPYDADSLEHQTLGGSEATLVRVTTALAKRNDVIVLQNQRKSAELVQGVSYRPITELDALAAHGEIDACVVMRKASHAMKYARKLDGVPVVLWTHDYIAMKNRRYSKDFARLNIHIVAVSHTHAGHIAAVMANGWLKAFKQKDWAQPTPWPVSCIYNPVASSLSADDSPVDRDQLVFFSSPQKGLPQVLKYFAAAKERIPSLKLKIANPGYKALESGDYGDGDGLAAAGVEVLGSLKQSEVHQHVRSALCVFYPQNVFPETFGLVFAEASAVGTPVLAHDFGAAPELLTTDELIDARDVTQVVDRLVQWHKGQRPQVSLAPQFRIDAVTERWEALLTRLSLAASNRRN